MNIIFEGVNGSGKTTIVKGFLADLKLHQIDYKYVSDLVYDTPLKPVLEMMFQESVFLEMDSSFKTSLFESLVLAANHHYIQEQLRNSNVLNIYDRDFISVLAYQKDIIKKEYNDWEKFYKPFKDILLFNLKEVDLLTYVSIPTEENIRRTEMRDSRKFSLSEIEMLHLLKKNMEEEIKVISIERNIPLLYLDGMCAVDENVNKINETIKTLKR